MAPPANGKSLRTEDSAIMNSDLTRAPSIVSRRTALVGFGASAFGLALNPRGLGAFAQPATPTDAIEQQFDITLSVPVLPAGPIYLWSTMYAVEPGLSVEYPGFAIETLVATLVWVQSGVLAITGEHGAVHRGSAALPDASPVAGELLLGPGDAVALELGPNHTYQMRSAGSEPLVFAEFWLVAGPAPSYPDPPGYRILDFYHDRSSVTLPAAAVATMHLTRMTLAADEKLEVPEDGWQMVLTDNPAPMARSWPGGVPHNIGTDPIAIVVMTADFQPVAASEATPST